MRRISESYSSVQIDAPRLSFVITELEVGGAERCLARLVLGLRERAIPIQVISLMARPRRTTLVEQLHEAGVEPEFLGLRSYWQLPMGVAALAKSLANWRPALVQSMLYHANVLTWLGRGAFSSAPWVAGVRVTEPSPVRLAFEGVSLRRADAVVCVSRGVAEHVRRRQQVEAERLVVIPNGVEHNRIEQVSPESLGLPCGARLIVAAGRLAPQKGWEQFWVTLPEILNALPEHHFLLVGEGPLRPELERKLAGGSWGERVHLLGWRDDLPTVLMAAELLVHPARWEGMSNVVLEAMAAGLPIVATRTAGSEELFGEDPRQLVPVAAMGELGAKVIAIASDRGLAHQLGTENQVRSRQFSQAAMVEAYSAVYRRLLGHKAGSLA